MLKHLGFRNTLVLFAAWTLVGCASDPKKPDGSSVRVSHEKPGSDCEQLEQVIGSSPTTKDAYSKALADIKKEAALITGNYVKIVAISAHGSAIRGIAYRCH